MITRWLKRLFYAILVLAVLLPIGLLGLLGSTSGTAWLLDRSEQFAATAGIELEIGAVNGTLLRQLELQGLSIGLPQQTIHIGKLALRWQPRALLEQTFRIEALTVNDLSYLGRSDPAAPPTPSEPPSLPDLQLPVRIQLDRATFTGLSIAQDGDPFLLDEVQFSATLDETEWRLTELRILAPELSLEADLGLAPEPPHALRGDLAGAYRIPDVGELTANLQLDGAALQPRFELEVSAPARLRASGQADLRELDPQMALTATWPRIAWPLDAPAQVISKEGELRLEGRTSAYQIALNTALAGPQLPTTRIRLQGEGSTKDLRFEPLALALLDGTIEATGRVDWSGAPAWDLQVTAAGLDPGTYAPEWPGQINAALELEGRLDGDKVSGSAAIQRLNGRLRGYPISGSGRLAFTPETLTARDLNLASGPNRLRVEGDVGKQLALDFSLDAPELAAILPQLSGNLMGEGKATGTLERPTVKAKLNAGALTLGDSSLERLGVSIDWAADGGQLQLSASQLKAGEQQVDEVTAGLTGTPQAHQLQIDANGPTLTLGVEASGGWSAAAWQGQLARLEVSEPNLGRWELVAPVPIALAEDRASVSAGCLEQDPARLCVDGGWRIDRGIDITGSLSNLPLQRVLAAMPEQQIEVSDSRINAQIAVTGKPDDPAAQASLDMSDGTLSLTTDAQILQVPFANVQAQASLRNDAVDLEFGFAIGPDGEANGQVRVGTAPQRELAGQVNASFPDLTPIAGLVRELDEISGRLRAEVALAGTLTEPRFSGEVSLADASARILPAGITLQDVNLRLQGEDDAALQLQGRATSGEGAITLDGQVGPFEAGELPIDLRVEGQEFLAVQLPEATVRVSPDLRLAGADSYHLSGGLLIPYARIEIESLPPSSVSVSSDEFIVGQTETPAEPAATRNLTAKVRVELGKSVSFKGFGLKTDLKGVLNTRFDRKGPEVNGKIKLENASYEAYGQDLRVEPNSRLLFAGPPDNPDLDLRAMRESRDKTVKAYLALTGPLKQPNARVYSEPSLSEAEALAYLLTGRGLGQGGEDADLAGAALSLGLSSSEPLLQTLGNTVGLDEVTIESGSGNIEESSLLLGKYLSPDLYMGYTQGLFEAAGAVLLRLRLSDRLELESRAGEQQSMDLYYRIEHD